MEIIDNFFQSNSYSQANPRASYRIWKQGKLKYHYWLVCKHKDFQYVDVWDRVILSKLVEGTTVVYDSAAFYYNRLLDNVLIIENEKIPLSSLDKYYKIPVQLSEELNGKVKNFISFRPRCLKQMNSLFNFFTEEQLTRSGIKPAIIDWLDDGAMVFLSLGQEFLAFNRFKKTLDQILEEEILQLSNIGFKLLTSIKSKGDDYANGRYKLIFQYKKH